MSKNKISKSSIPENFTVALFLVDLLPVLFFSGSILLLSVLLHSPIITIGGLFCFLSGFIKVLWKMIVAKKHKNIWWMFLQMRIVMPFGFIILIIGMILSIVNGKDLSFFQNIVKMPSLLFLIIGALGMILMMVFSFTLDSEDVKSNWIEQVTNAFFQGSIFLSLLFLLFL